MFSPTILVIEDQRRDFVQVLRLIGGDKVARTLPRGKTSFHVDVKTSEPGTLAHVLSEVVGVQSSLRVEVVNNTEQCERYLAEQDQCDEILAFLDLDIPGAKLVPIIGRSDQRLALSLFEKLLSKSVPLFVLSRLLDESFEAVRGTLRPIAAGRFFHYFKKGDFFGKLLVTAEERESFFTTLLAELFSRPLFGIDQHLKRAMKGHFAGSRSIAYEFKNLVYRSQSAGLRSDPKKHHEFEAEVEGIREELSAERVPPGKGVFDEVSPVEAVVIHEPGPEIELVTPQNSEHLLFNQPVSFRNFQAEYKTFKKTLEHGVRSQGGEVFTVRELLAELLDHPKHGKFLRAKLLIEVLKASGSQKTFWELLELEDLTDLVVAGTTKRLRGDGQKPVFDPIPNLMFARDWAFTVHNRAFLSRMNKPARFRERAIAEFLFRFHPLFQNLFDPTVSILSSGSIEGGDVMLASPKTILVGLSERTGFAAAQDFARVLFKNDDTVQRIVATPAPREHPKSMHLDTFIGFLDQNTALMYDDILIKQENTHFIIERGRRSKLNLKLKVMPFADLLKEILGQEGIDLNPISVSAANEQYDDACNVFAIAPGLAIIYSRVDNTIRKIEAAGWNVETSESYLSKVEPPGAGKKPGGSRTSRAKKHTKTLITIPGDELSLARGGPHCMTFPLSRNRG